MQKFLKQNIFIVFVISLVLILFDIFLDWKIIGLIGVSFILFIVGLFIGNRILRLIIFVGALFLLILSLLMIQSVWVLLLVIILFLILFRTKDGNELIHFKSALILPKKSESNYLGVQLIEPQSEQRTILNQESIFDSYREKKVDFEWDDVNIVLFGGNHILDFGNTILPQGETTIVIRKMFGRTRLIIPNDIGVKLNISTISGGVVFESQRYSLTADNFRWMSPDYGDSNRKVNVIVSVTFGDVEVIIL